MTDTTDLIARLRDNAQGISLGAEGMGWGFDEAMLNEAADALEQQAAEIAEKDAEIARLRADAERYRWLRDNTRGSWAICEWSYDEPEGYYKDARAPGIVDAAIDAALRQEQPKGEGA